MELKLYAFQHTRSQVATHDQKPAWEGHDEPLTTDTIWDDINLDDFTLDDPVLREIMPRRQVANTTAPNIVPIHEDTNEQTRPRKPTQTDFPLPMAPSAHNRTQWHVGMTEAPAAKPLVDAPAANARCTTTSAHGPNDPDLFMKARPGGPHATKTHSLKLMERQVLSKLQKKGTTSTRGHDALAAITTTVARKNKENEIVPSTGAKRKTNNTAPEKAKPTKNGRVKKTTTTVIAIPQPTPPTVQVDTVVCQYGCRHGGWVDLKQMMPYDTRHCLEKGNYFDEKHCVDCRASIGDVFRKSKNRAQLYYCQIDYNVSELCDNDREKAEQPCACILCLTCYYKREPKNNEVVGKKTRSSGRTRG